jgi:flagellar hook-associated protein 2
VSDNVFIPGISSKFNSQEAINKIMDQRKVKLTEMEDERVEYIDSKKSWSEIKTKVVSLKASAKKLFGFEAPFDEKISQSSNEGAFSATVTRNAEIGEYSLEILQKATAHRIASDSLQRNYKVSPGNYRIDIEDDTIKIPFDGGSLEAFTKSLKKASKDRIKATLTYNTPKTQVLVLEANKTGSSSIITFNDPKSRAAFKDMGFFEEINAFEKNFPFRRDRLSAASSKSTTPLLDENSILTVERQQAWRYDLPEAIQKRENLVMELDMRLISHDPATYKEPQVPTGPNLSRDGDIELFDIAIDGESSIIDIPPLDKKQFEKPPVITDNQFIEIITDKRSIEVAEQSITSNMETMKFSLDSMLRDGESVKAVIVKNGNTYKTVEASNLRFYDSTTLSGVNYRHEISRPQDARFKFEGIDIVRDTNTIDDLIKGVTLFLFNSTDGSETLYVDRDYDTIIESITGFLGEYNQLIELIDEKTRTGADVEGNRAEFAGEQSLVSLKSRIRIIMMNAYETDYADQMALLQHVGISTNESGGGGLNKEKLKGILEVNEDRFFEQLEENASGVKQLFGNDTDGDLLIDSGVAYTMDQFLGAYTLQGEGVFDMKMSSIDRKIEDQDKRIDSYKEKMDKEETDLRQKFYKMEKASNELEENTKKFDNFNRQK